MALPDRGATKLYLLCLVWGLAVGATAGAVFGASLSSSPGLGDGTLRYGLGLAVAGGFYGVIIGTVVSVLPSAILGLVVTGMIRQLHPEPSSADAVRRDLRTGFVALAGFLVAGLLVAIFAGGNGFSSVGRSLPYLAPASLCASLVLYLAAGSISRAWVRYSVASHAQIEALPERARAW